MYKHLLLATDGSEIGQHAVSHGLKLAKALGAKTTVMTVTMPWSAIAYGEMAVTVPPDDYEAAVKEAADKTLAAAKTMGMDAGVQPELMQVSDLNAYQAILAAAKSKGCDLIVVGSHGRSGLSRLLLGSETVKVLTHAKIPVLVWRE